MFRILGIIFLLVLSSQGLVAQSRGFISYSVSDGLAQSNVKDIAEDHLGNLWLATAAGLCKFNGVEFITYKKQDGLASNQVSCLAMHMGKIWVGTDEGITTYDGWEFQNYEIPSLTPDHKISKIMADENGKIWYATSAGSVAFISVNGSTVMFESPLNSIHGRVSGFTIADGTVWIATYKDGVFKYKSGQVEKVPVADELNKAVVTTIYSDDNQRVWLGTNKGLYLWNDGSFEFVHSFHVDYQDFSIYSISEEEQGTIWVGTTRGAFRFRDGKCSAVNAGDGLTDNIVYKILRDREGTLWFGSFGGGLYKSLGELFTKVGKQQGVSYDYISSITKDPAGEYWFGSYGGGVYQLTMPSSPEEEIFVKNFDHDLGLSNDFIYSIVPDDHKSLWIATAWGLNKFNNGLIEKFYQEHGLPANQILSMIKCGDGTLYCGTTMGLCRIKQAPEVKFENFQYKGGKPHNRIRTLLETDEGQLLLGTFGGLKTFDGQAIRDYFQEDSLKHLPVSTLCQDEQGGLWCALVDNGVLYYHPVTKHTKHITEKLGLSSNIVYSLVTDRQGCLWVGTPHGLDRICFGPQGEIELIRHFGASEGFFGVETNTNALYKESDGSIWFGTVEGAFKCSPQLDRPNHFEPITRITDLRLFSKKIDWTTQSVDEGGWYRLPVNLQLPHDKNHLTFEFFANSLKNPAKVKYQYKLENFDQDWQPITEINEAVYTNLPPGKYTFQVRASNNDGVWNQRAASLSFAIAPPFWRTWWFFLSTVLILGIAGRLYYKTRVQSKLKALMQVEKLKNDEIIKVRRRVAEDFHDQVGNQLASITVLVQLIQAKLVSGNKEIEELLQKLGQFTKTLFTGTRDFIWSIDPKSDRVNEMLIYIRDFGEELFEYSDVNFHVETNDTFKANAELPVGWSRHIVFIFKEALTNSFRHAGCKNVYLNFNVTDHNYVFELKDDGEGLNGYKDDDFLGMGFKSMKERAQKIGGEIEISSHEDYGTRIVLEGKIPQNE